MAWKKMFLTATNVIGIAGLAFAGYILLMSATDFRRYIRISTM